jgi:hypothetical protein
MRSLLEGPLEDMVTRMPYLLKFSIISRKIEQARTAKARFLNPWRETVSMESRLRQDVRFLECGGLRVVLSAILDAVLKVFLRISIGLF